MSAAAGSSATWDVLVVGAGIAGLGCARVLAERGLRVCVVEARERVGGRVRTERVVGQVVELGAEFVHGWPEELLQLIAEAGLHVNERGGSQVQFADGQLEEERDGEEDRFGPLEELRGFAGEDVSFADWLRGQDVPEWVRVAVTGYVEGFNAADAEVISARSLGVQQQAEEAIEGDRLGHVREGYAEVAEWLAARVRAAGGEVLCGVAVEAIRWGVGRVALETTAGEFVGTRAVITLPLGVLQAGVVRIVPEPRAVIEAAGLMRMGDVCRFSMVFGRRWWEEVEPQPVMRELSFLFDVEVRSGAAEARDEVGVWWTTHPEKSAILTGWVGGPRARGFLAKGDEALRARAVRQVARMFAVTEERVRAEMVGFGAYDWSADPLARGAYSYVGVGGVEASARMGEPVEHTLYFAGEHTDVTGHWGTVHGALRSGLRAAGQVLEAF